jgi:hypothetical protein
MTSRSRNGMNKLSIVDLRADRCALTSPDAPVPWELRILSLFECVRGVVLAKCCPRVDRGDRSTGVAAVGSHTHAPNRRGLFSSTLFPLDLRRRGFPSL